MSPENLGSLKPEQIHELIDSGSPDAYQFQIADGRQVVARGFGETYLLSTVDGSPLKVMQLTDIPLPSQQPDDTLDFVKEEHAVKEQFYVNGSLSGGITEDGLVIPHMYKRAPLLEELESAKNRSDSLAQKGLKEVLWPGFEHAPGRRDTIRRLSNYLLGRLLQFNPDKDLETVQNYMLSDISQIRPRFEVEIDYSLFFVSRALRQAYEDRPYVLLYYERASEDDEQTHYSPARQNTSRFEQYMSRSKAASKRSKPTV